MNGYVRRPREKSHHSVLTEPAFREYKATIPAEKSHSLGLESALSFSIRSVSGRLSLPATSREERQHMGRKRTRIR
jgi:hypothetical protein